MNSLFQKKVYPVRKIKRGHSQKRKSKFSNGVYNVVRKIPMGSFLTYKEVAEKAGFPKAWRTVGNVLNKNPSSSPAAAGHYGAGKNPKIPCHRVIRSNGKVGGFNRGKNQTSRSAPCNRSAINKKIALLKKEGIMINHGKATSRPTK